jgi:hypothetical protein
MRGCGNHEGGRFRPASPESLLVSNPLDRYLLNSTMPDDFVRDADGIWTLPPLRREQ